ncbi:MAG: flagellar M-ring protein FliF [Thermotoga sp.]|nr:MAG: flagellar M-ring protein FliF [Thermotoga sp.]
MEFLKKILNYLKGLFEKWKGLPTSQKILVSGILVSILVGFVFLIYTSLKVEYVVLVKNVGEREAGIIAKKLDDMGIPYKAGPGGTILVPKNLNVYSIRMKLASEGVLGTVTKGFELVETQPFGATSFDKQVRYQIALQGELERTISSLQAVKYARVHLTMPKYTYYVRGEMAKPKASVLVVLEPGMDLTPKQIRGIMELVAGAVEGLDVKDVRIVDNRSRILSDKVALEEESQMASTKMELKKMVEDYYVKKVRNSLEQVFGVGNVAVVTEVVLNWEKIEKESKQYIPTTKKEGIVVSQQTETENIEGSPNLYGGPVGAESNIPPTYESLEGQGKVKINRSKNIVNYNISEVYQKVIENRQGEVETKSITVFINRDSPTATITEEDAIKKAVANAVNATLSNVEVLMVPFDKTLKLEVMREIEKMKRQKRFVRFSILLMILTTALFFVSYLLINRLKLIRERKRTMMRRAELERKIAEMVKPEEIPPEKKEFLELKQVLEETAVQNPEEVVNILRLWLSE